MKKIINILAGAVLIGMASCNDILETIPTDRISSAVYWKTEQDAVFAANSIYTFLDANASRGTNPNSPKLTRIFNYDGMTDILHANIQYSDEAALERGEYDSNIQFVQNVWTESYKGIRAVNAFLENVKKIPVDNPARLNTLSAEVRTIRAYLYMNLVMLYGDIPLIMQPIETVSGGKDAVRTPASDVWSFITAELDQAAQILPVKAANKGRITKGAALALKARAYLWQNNWVQAEAAAKAVIDLGEYSLYPSYQKLFTYAAENNTEVILDKQFIKDTYSNDVFRFLAPFSLKKAGPIFVPTKNMFDAYRMTNGKRLDEPGSGYTHETQYQNRDPRLRYSIYIPGDTLPDGKIYDPTPGSGTQDEVANTYLATSLGYNIKKYINQEDLANQDNCGINIILIRYADILLTYAEARIEQGKIDDATLDAINQVRQRPDVSMPPVTQGLGQVEMREIVRNERQVELAFEGLRLFDCRRWRTAETLFPGKVYGMTYKNATGQWETVGIEGFLKVFDPNRHYLFPIPQKEMDLNKNFKQNPGW